MEIMVTWNKWDKKIPMENDQLESERNQKGLFDELYMDTATMEIVSLGPVDGKDAYKIKLKKIVSTIMMLNLDY